MNRRVKGRKQRWLYRRFIGVAGKRRSASVLQQDQWRIEMGTAGKRTTRRVLCAEAGVPNTSRQWRKLRKKDRVDA